MAEKPEILEKELRDIWLNAPNTRKRTAPRRISNILNSSRAELSLRDLLVFCIYLGEAFFMLLVAVANTFFSAPTQPSQSIPQRDAKK